MAQVTQYPAVLRKWIFTRQCIERSVCRCDRAHAAAARGAEIATSCSGVFLLASTGLLDGRRATTTWWLAPAFRRLYPAVMLDTDALVVRDSRLSTAGAAMAQMDLMLSVVAQHAGAKLADQCARYLLLDQRRSQSRYMALGFLAAADPRIAKAEAWARARLDKPFTVNDVAKAAGMAPRTFARHVENATGRSPVRFLQRLRVDAAIILIETTRLPFEEIARRVGYAEPSTLRRLLQPGKVRGGCVPAHLTKSVIPHLLAGRSREAASSL